MFFANSVEADLEFITGKSYVMVQRAYSNELFRIVHARTTGSWKAQVVTATEDNIFDIIKQWLFTGKDRSMLGQMDIRRHIVDPRKAVNLNDYAKAVAEWDANVAKLKGYGGELPNPQDLLASYMKILDNDSRAYAIDKISEAGHIGQYAGDAPIDFMHKLRSRKVW